MSQESPHLAWIGIGAMGLPMSRRLAAAGHALRVYDRDQARRALAADVLNLQVRDTVADALRGARTVFTMVFDDAALEAVADAAAEHLARGSLLVDMSTVSPAASARVAQRLQAKGIGLLRAPVSGSVMLAESGALTVFASGERADFDRVAPLLAALSQQQHFVGDGEAARVVKLAINLMVVASTSLIGEALALGEAQGVERAVLVDALNASIVGSRHFQSRADSLKTRRYGNAGPLDLVAKDLDLALALADAARLPLPLTTQVRGHVDALQREGAGRTEVSVLAELPRAAPIAAAR